MADFQYTTPAPNRRALFGGAGKIAVAGAFASLPVLATAALASHPDAAIIAALHRWRSAVLAYVASPAELESVEWEALLSRADDSMDAIIHLHPATVEGLAIKAFMALRFEYDSSGGNELLPNYSAGSMADDAIPRSMVADMLRLSPILAAAVA